MQIRSHFQGLFVSYQRKITLHWLLVRDNLFLISSRDITRDFSSDLSYVILEIHRTVNLHENFYAKLEIKASSKA